MLLCSNLVLQQIPINTMEKFALLGRFEAKPGKEQALFDFLINALPHAVAEPDTVRWYALKFSENSFGIFDTFETDAGRKAHMQGEIAKALMAHAPDLLAKDPVIEDIELIAIK